MKIRKKIQEFKMDIEKMSHYAIFILVIFSLLILVMLGYSLIGMRQSSISTTTNYVQSLTEQLTNMISLEISGRRQQLVSVGDSFEQVVAKKDDAAVEEFISRKQELCGFDFVVLDDTRNNRSAVAGILPREYTNIVATFHSLDTTQKAFAEGICEVGIENENVIYAMPLYDGEEEIGFIWAGNTVQTARDIIHSHSFQEQIYSCIINTQGDIILSSEENEEFRNLESVFKTGNNVKLQKNLQEMEVNITNAKSSVFPFVTENGYDAYLAYTPMEISNWIMLTIVPTNLLSANFNKFVYLALIAVVGTVLIFIGFFILMTQIYRSNRKKLEQLAYSDEITGGKNNQAFFKEYHRLHQTADIRFYAIILMDVVNFKEINKKFGMKQGDSILSYIHQVICSNLNVDKGEFVARSEMDHFFLCLKEQDEESIQQRLTSITKQINFLDGTKMPRYQIFFRMAATFIEKHDTDPILLEDRVRVMLKVTEALPGKCVFYSKEFEERASREQELNNAFEPALIAEEFHVYFQPKVSLKKGCIEGAEALVRWKHPKWGIVPPGDFIPMLEGNGKILRLDKYVFEKVCLWLQKRLTLGEPLIPVSVNLSRSNLLDDNFFDWYINTADKYGIPHEFIEFELTESTFMVQEQIQHLRTYITQMHESGFRISIDDFGTGYSSISLLREFDVDVLKLDRTFFLCLDDPKARDVIHCLVELAKKLHTRIVVEGIEAKKQINYLKELNCDVIQGYFFSRPLPEDEFELWCRNFNFKDYGV